jgi:hypothetical protein
MRIQQIFLLHQKENLEDALEHHIEKIILLMEIQDSHESIKEEITTVLETLVIIRHAKIIMTIVMIIEMIIVMTTEMIVVIIIAIGLLDILIIAMEVEIMIEEIISKDHIGHQINIDKIIMVIQGHQENINKGHIERQINTDKIVTEIQGLLENINKGLIELQKVLLGKIMIGPQIHIVETM